MGRPVLLLRLEGPLQSWGTRSRWDVRDTGPEPTKSGIVGLLGCALGYPMGDGRLETELDAGLRFGARVENAGHVAVDYQTVTGFLPTAEGTYRYRGGTRSLAKLESDPDATPATIVSPRSYLEDAAFLVALEERQGHEGLIAKCAEAVKRPVWPVYLGRKACAPTRPVFEELTEDYEGLEDALGQHPWSWLGAAKTNRPNGDSFTVHGFVEDEAGPLLRQDAVRINAARQFGFRRAREFRVTFRREGAGYVSVQVGA